MIRILAASSPGEIRVAAVRDGKLEDFFLWRPGRPDRVGDVYRARVLAHVPALAGAFLGLPEGDGFLPDSQGGTEATEGTLLTVRVTRASQGGKGPRLSAKLPQAPGLPGLVCRGPSPVEDLAARHPDAPILTDDPALAAELRPALGQRLRLADAVFDAELEEDIADLFQSEVELAGGVRASFHPTPALVAIDMDTGGASAGRQNKPAAQFAANRAALPGLAHQIRLRNLSGAILLDLAGLSVKRRAQLGPDLSAALSADPLRPRLLGFTALRLAEIVRARIRPPLHELIAGPHAAGLVALRAVAREAATAPHRAFRLRAAPDVTAGLEADPVALPDLARRTGRPLILVPDPALSSGSWQIETDRA